MIQTKPSFAGPTGNPTDTIQPKIEPGGAHPHRTTGADNENKNNSTPNNINNNNNNDNNNNTNNNTNTNNNNNNNSSTNTNANPNFQRTTSSALSPPRLDVNLRIEKTGDNRIVKQEVIIFLKEKNPIEII